MESTTRFDDLNRENESIGNMCLGICVSSLLEIIVTNYYSNKN